MTQVFISCSQKDIDPSAAWQEMACAVAGRSLVPEEWAVYLPAGEPYQPVFP